MATVTLLQLRTRARERADMQSTGFITDSELNGYINSSYAELYDLLVSKYGEEYFVAPAHSITTTSNVDTYALPADFYKLLGVDLQLDSSQWKTLKRFEFSDRNTPRELELYSPERIRYRIFGSNLLFSPVPAGNLSLRAWYIPLPTTLSLDADSFSGINGYEEYVVIDAAIKMLTKEESDTTALMITKEALKRRIEQMAEARDVAMPMTVQDTTSINVLPFYPF